MSTRSSWLMVGTLFAAGLVVAGVVGGGVALTATRDRTPLRTQETERSDPRPERATRAMVGTPAPVEQVVRFNTPLTSGPYPVNGNSLEQLVAGVPLFPPIEGIDEKIWKKPCSSCHKWERQTLCEQGAYYIKDPKAALRKSHPYGGAEKLAMMEWAKAGCQ